MRRKLFITVAIAVLVLIVAAFVLLRIRASQDEGPIIVQNGSIDIATMDGEWKDGGNSWFKDSPGTVNRGDLWVKVTSSTGTCRAIGKPVHIEYSVPGNQVTFTTSGMWGFAKTHVTPRSGKAFVDRQHLRAGSPGDGGHITEVRAQSQTCSLTPQSQNVRIAICSSSGATDCR
jgi:hypothetical protein